MLGLRFDTRRVGFVWPNLRGCLEDFVTPAGVVSFERSSLFFELLNVLMSLHLRRLDNFLKYLRRIADLLDLAHHEIFDLFGWDRFRCASMPAAFLGGTADVVAISLIAGLGCVVRCHGCITAHATHQAFEPWLRRKLKRTFNGICRELWLTLASIDFAFGQVAKHSISQQRN